MTGTKDNSRALVELPMLLFLRIADGDGAMSAQEMERFDALLRAPDWCRSPLLRQSLALTEKEKGALWRRYVDGDLSVDSGAVATALDSVLGALASDQQALVEQDLLSFSRRILEAADRHAGWFKSDAKAHASFDALDELIRRPSARGRAAALHRMSKTRPAPTDSDGALHLALAGEEAFWRGGKLPLRCIRAIDETHDVKTFDFVCEPRKFFCYEPGQFLTLELPIDGRIVRRSYTISSSPSRPHILSVTVKRVENGLVSNWLHDHLHPGMTLSADGPYGKFTCVDGAAGPYLFISGGSGVTPVMAMARWLLDTTADADIRFVHFARRPEDFVYESELRLLESRFPNFRCGFACSRATPDEWSGALGRFSVELLSQLAPDMMSRSVYLCGPDGFTESVRAGLAEAGYDMARFAQESFGGAPSPAAASPKPIDAPSAKIVFSASGKEIACTSGDYVLDIALANGIEAAYSCRAGQCGVCKTTALEGRAVHDCSDGLTEDDVAVGLILACRARPEGKLIVDL
ncbi:hybrid-cluster NAD(P)-dependent oxidoreductase [Methylosinus sporium]|uniref:Hybrid-cluster NAD(P)-dependent oxidoreductase n=1 Tax=Methylosinus sporium TaxID=428 RepID=A0A549T8S5_METSR|nr:MULTISPECIES: hybrid-cluster NAD(P)-dependent oxidoreductase [Methylosinus]MBU3890200.1 hybrid-cluster NAD(P)-dependent oxidoreductase [Methylosinus sp. KRF6]TRL38272.1 hybrid-cluster NAD(P)-dependent oxidoreductase [Methylosinus sporium]